MSYLDWTPLQGVSDYVSTWFTEAGGEQTTNRYEDPQEHPPSRSTSLLPTQMFYSVALTDDTPLQDDDEPPFVFNSMVEVLSFCKRYKSSGPRWKSFSDRASADKFSVDMFPYVAEHKAVDREPMPFKAATQQQLAQLRQYIEEGEFDEVRKLIECNPRYLIGRDDHPPILDERCGYNAFHIGAKTNQAEIMKLIMTKLRSETYFKQLFPADDDQTTRDRIAFIVDFYLNTYCRTKRGETPLHYATKFGSVSSVKFFVCQRECDRNLRNCEGYAADEIICERGGGEPETRKIEELFAEHVVIPVLRKPNGDELPGIRSPISIRQLPDLISPPGAEAPNILAGFAGPMPGPRAFKMMKDIYEARYTWESYAVKRRDPDKSTDLIVRSLARKHKVPWCEYWPFLDCAVDITTGDGLRTLNTYLNGRTYIYGNTPSKADHDVWFAMYPVVRLIEDGAGFRSVKKWFRLMKQFSPSEMKAWTPTEPQPAPPLDPQVQTDACLVHLIDQARLDDDS